MKRQPMQSEHIEAISAFFCRGQTSWDGKLSELIWLLNHLGLQLTIKLKEEK